MRYLLLLSCLTACGSSAATGTPPLEPRVEPSASAEPRLRVITSSEAAGAVNTTLVMSAGQALIVDAQFTRSSAEQVAAALIEEGVTPTTLLITHAHPDHFLGARTLIESFPDLQVVATADVVSEMQANAAGIAEQQAARLGDEFPGAPVIPTLIESDTIRVGDSEVQLLSGLQGDTHPITGVLIPTLRTLVASDVVFSGAHVWTADSSVQSRRAWMAQLDELAGMPIDQVIPGHQAPGADLSPAAIAFTRAYVQTFDDAAAEAESADALIAAVSAEYPDLVAPFFLQFGAQAAMGGGQ